MKYGIIPTCYFPSTAIFVDDSRDFLMNFTLQLDERLAYQIYSSPYDAIEAICTGQQYSNSLNERCISEYLEGQTQPSVNQMVNLDLSAIHWEVYNNTRFNEVTTVIVDYAMPGMNGLEFCKRIEDTQIKKILLTGQAEQNTVIEAFNAGIIDRFIRKSDPNVVSLISESIQELQQNYFRTMSDHIIKMLSVTSPTCLQDPIFVNFFQQICRNHRIVEFYLMESSGSFLMLDADAKVKCLIVKNNTDLKMYHDLARDNKVSEEILQQITQGEKIPFFYQDAHETTEWNEWSSCLYPAQRLDGHESYYYALIDGPAPFGVQKEKILSYNDFLNNLDASQESLEQETQALSMAE